MKFGPIEIDHWELSLGDWHLRWPNLYRSTQPTEDPNGAEIVDYSMSFVVTGTYREVERLFDDINEQICECRPLIQLRPCRGQFSGMSPIGNDGLDWRDRQIAKVALALENGEADTFEAARQLNDLLGLDVEA